MWHGNRCEKWKVGTSYIEESGYSDCHLLDTQDLFGLREN